MNFLTAFSSRAMPVLLVLASLLPAAAQSPDSLRLQAFAQGRASNCISVALIKAAIHRYGVGQVFDTLHVADGQMRVTLRDHTVLWLTAAERQQAAWAAHFARPATALPPAEQAAVGRYATLCYAVLAKYVQTQHIWGCTSAARQPAVADGLGSYRRALRRLRRRSLCSDNAYRHLGLSATAATAQAPAYTPGGSRQAGQGAVAYDHGHAVFVLGQRYDSYGTWQPLAATAQANQATFKPLWYFELE